MLPHADWSVAVRPLTNFCVALFVYLSGFLTVPGGLRDVGAFYRRRLGKIVAPYLLWSLVYLAAQREVTPLAVLRALVTGTAAPQLYYLLVYLQLVLLTPFLDRVVPYRWARRSLWLVTPAVLGLRYGLAVVGVGVPLQAEGFAWLAWGSYDLATTQLKLSAMLTSLATAGLLMGLPAGLRGRVASCIPLVRLGDASYGVYLDHMAFVMVLGRLLPGAAPLEVLAKWALVLALGWAAVTVCRRLLPRRALRAMGFE